MKNKVKAETTNKMRNVKQNKIKKNKNKKTQSTQHMDNTKNKITKISAITICSHRTWDNFFFILARHNVKQMLFDNSVIYISLRMCIIC